MNNIKNTSKLYTAAMSAIYTMVFFNGFYYLIVGNLLAYIPMTFWPNLNFTNEVIIKGFIIGLTAPFIFEKVSLKGFFPYGFIGAILGLHVGNLVVGMTTSFGSMYLKGFDYATKVTIYFLIVLSIGSLIVFVMRRIAGLFRYKSAPVEGG